MTDSPNVPEHLQGLIEELRDLLTKFRETNANFFFILDLEPVCEDGVDATLRYATNWCCSGHLKDALSISFAQCNLQEQQALRAVRLRERIDAVISEAVEPEVIH